MNFLNTWQQLDEIYDLIDFKDGSNTQYYHFFEDLSDLVSCLTSQRIYSNKNIRASQLDIFAPDDSAYVCMTVGEDGKRRTAYAFNNRSVGISFKNLTELCNNNKYLFNPDKAYSQFAAKTQYDTAVSGKIKGNPTRASSNKNISAFRDFELLAIGELDGDYAGHYFISGGQGRTLGSKGQKHWSSKLFTDKKLYDTLYNWFRLNMRRSTMEPRPLALQPHTYYHFKDNYIGSATDEFKPAKSSISFPINTDGQLNPEYIPWRDKKSTVEEPTFYSAMNFTMNPHKVKFKEIIGVGPFMVKDNVGNVLLKMDLVKPDSEGGYPPSRLFGANSVSGDFADEDRFTQGRHKAIDHVGRNNLPKESQPTHLQMSAETAAAIAELYNESEYRVYIPNKRDFVFDTSDINSIVLPAEITMPADKSTIKLDLLVQLLFEDPNIVFPAERKEFIEFLNQSGIVVSKSDLNDYTYKLLLVLVKLLQEEYNHVTVELIGGHNSKARKISTAYTKNSATDELSMDPDQGQIKGKSKTRYVVNFNIMDEIVDAREHVWNNVTSVIARLDVLQSDARLGAETILIGKDKSGEKYVLFVNNEHKAKNFLELPGGGLHKIPVRAVDFEAIAKQRLYFKGGIEQQYITNFTDTGKGLLLYEKETAQDLKNVTWPWSYYKLFTAQYNKEIAEEDIDYSFDNTSTPVEIRAKGEDGYTCFLRWIPIKHIDYNTSILLRYSNIIPMIKQLAN